MRRQMGAVETRNGGHVVYVKSQPTKVISLEGVWSFRETPEFLPVYLSLFADDPSGETFVVATGRELLRVAKDGHFVGRVRLRFPPSMPPAEGGLPIYELRRSQGHYLVCRDWGDVRGYNPIIEFDSDGSFVRAIPPVETLAPDSIPAEIQSFCVLHDGSFVVTLPGQDLVARMTPDGRILKKVTLEFNTYDHSYRDYSDLPIGTRLNTLQSPSGERILLTDGHFDYRRKAGQRLLVLTDDLATVSQMRPFQLLYASEPMLQRLWRPIGGRIHAHLSPAYASDPWNDVRRSNSATWLDVVVRQHEIVLFIPHSSTFVKVSRNPRPFVTSETLNCTPGPHGIVLKDGTICLVSWFKDLVLYPRLIEPDAP